MLKLLLLLSLSIAMSPLSASAQLKNLGDKRLEATSSSTDGASGLIRKDGDPLTVTARFNPDLIEPEQIIEVEIKMKLAEGYKAYEDQFRISIEDQSGFKIARYNIKPVKEFYDDFSKKNRKGVIDEATLTAAVGTPKFPSGEPVMLKLTYQACTKSYCLFPKTIPISIGYTVKGGTKNLKDPSAASQSLRPSGIFKQSFAEAFSEGLAWTFFFVFLAGVLTSFTPCIFPMIPITLAVLAKDAHLRTRGQSFLLSVAYVFGIALTYSLLGLLAAGTGALFGAAISSPWVLGSVSLMFLVMALSLFGLFQLEAPRWIQDKLGGSRVGGGLWGAFATGIISGLVASPCVGPVLVGILTYVAQTQDMLLGFFLLFVFALGLGQIFLVLGAFTNLTKKLPHSGPWLNLTKKISGLMMLAVFYYYLDMLLPLRMFDFALAAGLILLGSLGGAFDKNSDNPIKKIQKGLGWAALIFGIFLLIVATFQLRPHLSAQSLSGQAIDETAPSLNWEPLTEEALKKAKAEGKPVLIDFYADWCAACHELDRLTFTNKRVQLAATQFKVLRFDATNDSEALKTYKQKYGIIGLPWVVFIDKSGTYKKDLTLTGFEEPTNFLDRMNQAL